MPKVRWLVNEYPADISRICSLRAPELDEEDLVAIEEEWKPQATPTPMRSLIVAKQEAIRFSKEELDKVCSLRLVGSYLRHVHRHFECSRANCVCLLNHTKQESQCEDVMQTSTESTSTENKSSTFSS